MILEKIQQILAQQFEVSADSINADTNIVDDLGADSLDVVELIMSVEDEFGVPMRKQQSWPPSARSLSTSKQDSNYKPRKIPPGRAGFFASICARVLPYNGIRTFC